MCIGLFLHYSVTNVPATVQIHALQCKLLLCPHIKYMALKCFVVVWYHVTSMFIVDVIIGMVLFKTLSSQIAG